MHNSKYKFIVVFYQTTATDKVKQLTKKDLLEGLNIGQKYVKDLEKLESDMVIRKLDTLSR